MRKELMIISADQHRKFLLTIQNPLGSGYTHEMIRDIFQSMNVTYYCMADETATTGTVHTHVFLYRKSAIRLKTIQKKFPSTHYDFCYGSCAENRAYVSKTGKYAGTEKAETAIEGSFEEFGELPDERAEKDPKNTDVIEAIDEGKSTEEIIRENPMHLFRTNEINTLRETLLTGKYLNIERDVHVTYIYGPTGAGKTRFIFDTHELQDICRVTNYGNASGVRFDSYHGQSVLVFEEFHSQIPVEDMLNYLDRYPLILPARYSDRTACYSQVYITSNVPLKAQYPGIQYEKPEVWQAFLRRITTVIQFFDDGSFVELMNKEEVL